jgi:hypothetical protein
VLYDKAIAGTDFGNSIGRAGAKVAAFFGNEEAKAALQAEYNAQQAQRRAASGPTGRAGYLPLTSPVAANMMMSSAGLTTPAKIGDGRLDVAVRVTDERVTTSTSVAQPMSLIRINPGNTNPAGYAAGGAR